MWNNPWEVSPWEVSSDQIRPNQAIITAIILTQTNLGGSTIPDGRGSAVASMGCRAAGASNVNILSSCTRSALAAATSAALLPSGWPPPTSAAACSGSGRGCRRCALPSRHSLMRARMGCSAAAHKYSCCGWEYSCRRRPARMLQHSDCSSLHPQQAACHTNFSNSPILLSCSSIVNHPLNRRPNIHPSLNASVLLGERALRACRMLQHDVHRVTQGQWQTGALP